MRFIRIHALATGIIAIALATATALIVSLAPVAAADPPPLARAEAALAATRGSAPAGPNPDEQIVEGATASTGPCSEVCSAGGYGNVPARLMPVVASDNGFHWGDAGIGAGAILVLVGVGLGCTRAATSRKRRAAEERLIAT